ncbi:MAG TPA: hypothetical protein VEV16_01190 [Daejeonella sp.]|nr:hypothetical protein [Daejeonella sp.]
MNIVEQRIWDYLDGTCSSQERKDVETLIHTDPVFQAAYQEQKALHESLSTFELEEPSMAFTRNVMELVKLEPRPGSVKSLIDKRIIYGIAAFFLITITAFLIAALWQVNWTEPASGLAAEYQLPKVDFSKYLSSTLINMFFFADIILGLYLLDSFLRKRLVSR